MTDKDKSTVDLLSLGVFTVSCMISLISFVGLNKVDIGLIGNKDLKLILVVLIVYGVLLALFGTLINDIIKAKNSRLLTKSTEKICITAIVIQIITSISCGAILYKKINAAEIQYLNIPIEIIVTLSLIYYAFILIILMIAGTRKTNME